MIKKYSLWIILSVFSIFLGAGIFWANNRISENARKKIYAVGDKTTAYPGEGVSSEDVSEKILANPKGEGLPIFIDPDRLPEFPPDLYDYTEIPAQSRFNYAVGKFYGWEDIPESEDKYILLQDPETGGIDKYYVGFVRSPLFGPLSGDASWLGVEKITLFPRIFGANKKEKIKSGFLPDIGYPIMSRLIRLGDAIIITPVDGTPIWSKRDQNGHILVQWLIVRRAGGARELQREIDMITKNK